MISISLSFEPPFNELTKTLHKKFNFEIFLGRCLLLKNCGFHLIVNFVSYPEQLYLYDRYNDIFSKYGIEMDLVPWNGSLFDGKNTGQFENIKMELDYCRERSVLKNRRFDQDEK